MCVHTGVFIDSTTEFTVDASPVTRTGEGKVKCLLNTPNGSKVNCQVKNQQDGTYKVQYTPVEQGLYVWR